MPNSVESEIRARVESFTEEIVALIRASAMDVVSEALGKSAGRGARRPGRPRGGASPGAGRRKGAKRDPRVIEALTAKLGAFIKANPGKRIEDIAAELGTTTKELNLSVKKLIKAKRVSTKGEKRATKYYPR